MTFSKCSRELLRVILFCFVLGFCFCFLVSFPSALLSVRRPRSLQLRQPLDSGERPPPLSVGAGTGPAVAGAPRTTVWFARGEACPCRLFFPHPVA